MSQTSATRAEHAFVDDVDFCSATCQQDLRSRAPSKAGPSRDHFILPRFAESCPLLRVSFLWAIGAEATSEEDGKHCQGPKRAPACAKKLGQVLRRGACDRKRGGSDVVCSC